MTENVAHTRDNTRIFHKQRRSPAAAGHQVSLAVAVGKRDGVRIVDARRPKGRPDRMVGATCRVMRRAREAVFDHCNWSVKERKLLACNDAAASGSAPVMLARPRVISLANGI